MIGFLNTSYTVGESDGLVNIQIGINNGSLPTSVAVNFSISENPSDGSKLNQSMQHYDIVISILNIILAGLRVDTLLLSSTTPIIDLTVAITDYLFMFSESVVANITFPGEPISGVALDPASATINIDGLLLQSLCVLYVCIMSCNLT